jgi:hypothetical protein
LRVCFPLHTIQKSLTNKLTEIPNPSKEGPILMIYAVMIGTCTGFGFLTVLLFCMGDIQDVITATEGYIFHEQELATRRTNKQKPFISNILSRYTKQGNFCLLEYVSSPSLLPVFPYIYASEIFFNIKVAFPSDASSLPQQP